MKTKNQKNSKNLIQQETAIINSNVKKFQQL